MDEKMGFIVKDDSMGPNIKNGDCAQYLPNADYKDGDIVIVKNESGELMIKRYSTFPNGEKWLFTDNPEYPSFRLDERYEIIGRVVELLRPLDISLGSKDGE